jgi:hypothetical protein
MNRKNLERVLWLCVAIGIVFLAVSYDRNRTQSVVVSADSEVILAPYSANPEALRVDTTSDTVDVDYNSLPLSANPEALRDQNSMTLLPGETWTYSYGVSDRIIREVTVINESSTNLNFDSSLFFYSPDDLLNCPHSAYVIYGSSENPVVYVGSSTELRISTWSLVYDMWSYLCGPRVAAPENFDYYVTYGQK